MTDPNMLISLFEQATKNTESIIETMNIYYYCTSALLGVLLFVLIIKK